VYPPRTAGTLHIEGLPDNLHTLSVTIAGHDSLPAGQTSGMEEWPHQPAHRPLPPFSGEWLPEYEGHILSGTLTDRQPGAPENGKPLPLLGFTGRDIRLFSGQTDSKSNVLFFTKRIAGMHELATTVLSPSSPNRYRIDIQSPFAGHTFAPLPDLELKPEWNDHLLKRSVALQVQQSCATGSADPTAPPEAPRFRRKPEWHYRLDEYTRFPTMAEVVIEFIPGLRFRKTGSSYTLLALTEERTGFARDGALVLLDGAPVADHTIIHRYNPLLIEEIEVYKGKYSFGGALFDGIASFKTYGTDYAGLTAAGTMQFFDYEGTQPPRPHPSPSPQTEEQRRSRLPDCRHTLLWQPEVKPAGSGALVPFTTSDLTGTFRIRVEGLTASGEKVSATAFIRVE
jgi:hypothetical protein